MKVTDRVPEEAPLVVHPQVGRILARQIPALVLFAALALMNLIFLLRDTESSMPDGLRIFLVVCFAAMTLMNTYMLRVTAFTGPYLAADQDQVWLRVGGIRRPRVAVLPWTAVQDVRLHESSRAIYKDQYICVDAPSLVDEAKAQPGISRYARGLKRLTGTPFAASVRYTQGDKASMVARLKKYASATAQS